MDICLYNEHRSNKERYKAMATVIGETKADGLSVNVSEYYSITRIYQDTDQILIVGTTGIDALITKLQEAKRLILEVNKEAE
jgi:hypothetical protein